LRAPHYLTGVAKPQIAGESTINKSQLIDELGQRMTLAQKIGQCVVVGMSGTVITNDLREAITRYHCGGVRLSPFCRVFRYFSDERAKKQEVGSDFVPSMQKMAKQGISPHVTPEQFAGMLNELRDLAAQRDLIIPLQLNTIRSPHDIFDHPALFSQLLEEEWHSLQTYETAFGYDQDEEMAGWRPRARGRSQVTTHSICDHTEA
jgi:hypothetical protein